jgi:hypothetical protein
MTYKASLWSPRSGEILVAVGAAAHCRCAYSRHPRYRMQNQPHPGGVQQNVESSACGTPPGCDMIEQSIPWVARIRATHGYQYYTTPWCGTSMLARMGCGLCHSARGGGIRLQSNAVGARRGGRGDSCGALREKPNAIQQLAMPTRTSALPTRHSPLITSH